ncbi:MAG TPA: hypothetical protein VH234_04970 [Candidatus Saccharimonadales bacterium]|jgi:hypothetical protein|nr:hypothetical protein [Candidatus Saccharimonadales bacterium]
MADDAKKTVEGEVLEVVALERSLIEMTDKAMSNPQFRQFLEAQRETQAKIAAFWKHIEGLMIENNVKRIPADGAGEWGSIVITERTDFETTDELPRGYKKLVPDRTKIANHFKLGGKPPKGATPVMKKFLTKNLKLGNKDD